MLVRIKEEHIDHVHLYSPLRNLQGLYGVEVRLYHVCYFGFDQTSFFWLNVCLSAASRPEGCRGGAEVLSGGDPAGGGASGSG